MKSEISEIRYKILFKQLNNKEGSEKYKKCSAFDEKTAKSPMTFRKNKPNSNPIPERPKMNLRSAIKMNYKDFAPMVSKKQTQFKPRTNPIYERLTMNNFVRKTCAICSRLTFDFDYFFVGITTLKGASNVAVGGQFQKNIDVLDNDLPNRYIECSEFYAEKC